MGCTDTEACLYADIEPATLYNYQKIHPEFIEKKSYWKENPLLKARKILNRDLDLWDSNTAKWLLERKAKAEFSTKTEIGLTDKDGEDRNLTVIDSLNNLLWHIASEE